MKASLLFLLVSLIIFASGHLDSRRRDACIWGGGATGSYAAVRLQDKGYKNVVVLEKEDRLGGMCNTVYGPDGTWNDPGVLIWPNTTLANTLGFGPWVVDMVAWTERFGVPDPIIPSFFTGIQSFLADYQIPLYLGPAPVTTPSPIFTAEYTRFTQLMATTLLWMDTMNAIPGGYIPPSLRVSFTQWLVNNNFTVLTSEFLGGLYFAGFGDFDNDTAFDALLQNTVTNLLYAQGGWFSIRQGCQSVYNNIATYLGDSVRLGVTVDHISRPHGFLDDGEGVIITGYQNGKRFVEVCDTLIVTVAETLSNLEPVMELSEQEYYVFQNVQTRYYFTGTFEGVVNTALMSPNFTLSPVDLANGPTFLPLFPTALGMYRKFNVGPIVVQAFSEVPISTQDILVVINDALNNMVEAGVFLSVENVTTLLHAYNPHWPRDQPSEGAYLGDSISPYDQIEDIQGQHRTFYGGILLSTPNTMIVYNKIHVLLDKFFPNK
jgi:hypothetical protein